MEIITRKAALTNGATYFFTGKACSNGHVAKRRVDSYSCVECTKNAGSKYRKTNPEKVKETARSYIDRNREKELKRYAAYYAGNKSRALEKNRAWHAKNPDARRRYNNDYKAKKIAGGGSLSKDIVEKLMRMQKGKCACCKQPLGSNFHIDHIIPLALGGSNTDDNVQLLRQRCNNQKRDKHPVDFMQSRGYLL